MKSVFVVLYQGEQLKGRVVKICEGYHASVYPCPEGEAQRKETAMGVQTRLDDLNLVLKQTKDHRHRVLKAAAKHMRTWTVKIRKIKVNFNLFVLLSISIDSS